MLHLQSSSHVSKSLYLVIKSISNNFWDVSLSLGFLHNMAEINSLNSGETVLFDGNLIESVTLVKKYFTILYKSFGSVISKGVQPR